jgi:plasmid stabilization system protein ParE
MALKWTVSAERDLVRLHAFLAPVNSTVAAKVVKQLVAGAQQLLAYPQLGVPLDEFAPRNVRREWLPTRARARPDSMTGVTTKSPWMRLSES